MEKDSGNLSCLMMGTRWGDVKKEYCEILRSGHPLEAGEVDVLYLFPFPDSPRSRRLGEMYWLDHQLSCYNKSPKIQCLKNMTKACNSFPYSGPGWSRVG